MLEMLIVKSKMSPLPSQLDLLWREISGGRLSSILVQNGDHLCWPGPCGSLWWDWLTYLDDSILLGPCKELETGATKNTKICPIFLKWNWNYVISESWAEMMPRCDFPFFCSFHVMYEIVIVQCNTVKSWRRFQINRNVDRIFFGLLPGKCLDRRFFHNVYYFSCCQHLSIWGMELTVTLHWLFQIFTCIQGLPSVWPSHVDLDKDNTVQCRKIIW